MKICEPVRQGDAGRSVKKTVVFWMPLGCMLMDCQERLNLLKFPSIFQRPATVNESTDRLCPRFDG